MASTTASSSYKLLREGTPYGFNGVYNGLLYEFVHVELAIELPDVLPDRIYIECLMILFDYCLEFVAQFLIGEGLIPQVLNVVVKWLQRKDIQNLLQNAFFFGRVTMLYRLMFV